MNKNDLSLVKLISFDLSMNNVNWLSIEEYEYIELFVDKYSHLKKIKFQDSNFCQDLLLLTHIEKSKLRKPTTKTFSVYESSTIPNISLIDSRGKEKGDYNVDEVVKEITNYVESRE